jgi:integrase
MALRSGQSGTVVQKGNMWRGRYLEDVAGQEQRVYRSVFLGLVAELTKAEAKRKLKEYIQQTGIDSEQHFVKATSPIETFRQKATWWADNVMSFYKPATKASMTNQLNKHILPRLGDLTTSQITERTMQEFISTLHRRNELAPKTIHNIIGVIKLIIGKPARDWDLKLPQIPRTEQPYFTLEQMQQIIAAASPRYRLIFVTLANTGMRIGELAGLHVSDVDFEKCTITIRRSCWHGREQEPKTSNAYRTVTIDKSLADALKIHLAGRTTGRLFCSRIGSPLESSNLGRRVLAPLLKKLGIKGSLHSFRHGRVSQLQQNGVPGDLIKEWIGHSNLRITSRYTHFDHDYRQEIASKLAVDSPHSPRFDV